jgi:CRISPR-associated protein Cmr4
MYQKAYGIIETLAPLHVGASAGEETGNLNLIFRDQFTQTGIVPGSSIRGRFRADMRQNTGKDDAANWYGAEAKTGDPNSTSEGIVKFEYASLLWIPVYCPNQPVVRVSCPALLRRYQMLAGLPTHEVKPYSFYGKEQVSELFFNLGFLKLNGADGKLKDYMPTHVANGKDYLLVVVDDKDMAMIHDMALYRQSRVSLETETKIAKRGAFFNVEALPEGSILTFPIALRKTVGEKAIAVQDFLEAGDFMKSRDMYFGGLESIGFGRAEVTVTAQTQVTK